MSFNWKEFGLGNMVVHCSTKEKAKDFLKQADKMGYTWVNNDSLLEHTWFFKYKSETYYHVNCNHNMTCGKLDYYSSEYWHVINWKTEDSHYVLVTIDPTNPQAAHESVNRAISEYNEQHKPKDWTDEEVKMAKELCHKMLCDWFDKGYSAVFYSGTDYITIKEGFGHPFAGSRNIVSKPAHDDFFNEWIGKCVGLCKLTGAKIPQFILDKNK